MKFINYFLITTFILSLLGCELMPTRKTQAEITYERDMAKVELAEKAYTECLNKRTRISLEYVANNIRVIDEPPITKNKYELLQSKRYFEDKDKEHLFSFLNETDACHVNYENAYNKIDSRWSSLFQRGEYEKDKIYLQFMTKEINVSELNEKMIKLTMELNQEGRRLGQQKTTELEKAHNQEIDRSIEVYKADQEVAAARAANRPPTTNWGDVYFDLMRQNQQNQNKMKTTNCFVYGNTVNCQTY